MSEIITYQPSLPIAYQMELEMQRNRMDRITMLAIDALEASSEIYRMSVFKAISTVHMTAFWEQAIPKNEMSPEIEGQLSTMKMDYLAVMQKIPREQCEKIVTVLQNASLEPEDFGLRDIVLRAFLRFLSK